MGWRAAHLSNAFLVTLLFVGPSCSFFEDLEREGPKARTAETVRISIEFMPTVEGETVPKKLEGLLEGEIVDGGERARVTMDIPETPGGVPGPDIEFVFVQDGPIYFRPIADANMLPEGKRWVLMDRARAAELIPWIENYLEFLTTDRFLRAVTFDSEDEIGNETVRGVETTIYSFSEDVEHMADVVGMSEERLEALQDEIGERLELTFWLDEDGFTRRMDMPAGTVLQRPSMDDSVVIRFELFDFDADIEVTLPPESEVVEA